MGSIPLQIVNCKDFLGLIALLTIQFTLFSPWGCAAAGPNPVTGDRHEGLVFSVRMGSDCLRILRTGPAR